MFIAKFLFAIDTRVNLWLESCEESGSREEVDNDLIDFSQTLNQIHIRNFEYKLPPSIRKVIESDKLTPGKSDCNAPPKRSKYNQDDQGSARVSNKGKIDSWIPDQDTYTKALRNSEALRNRPKIDDTIMCHRFHSKDYCFKNCNNRKSHIPSASLNSKTKTAYC